MKTNLIRYAAVVLIMIAGAIQSPSQNKPRSASDAIRAADEQWMRVFSAKDLERSVAFCTKDGSVLAPNFPIATGREAIKQLFAGMLALPNLKIEWKATRVEAARSGDMGYSSGAYQMTFNDPSGKQITDRGKYVTVWKKQTDGSWKVALDIFNSDLPAGS